MTALQFLFSLERLGMKFGLENMRAICAALDHPESAFRSVIVAGTNGKGSVSAMLSASLEKSGQGLGMNNDELVIVPVATAQALFNTNTLFRVLVEARKQHIKLSPYEINHRGWW